LEGGSYLEEHGRAKEHIHHRHQEQERQARHESTWKTTYDQLDLHSNITSKTKRRTYIKNMN